jgi:hypothetical protein
VDAGDSLWHCVLDEAGAPERVQVRVGSGADAVDVTFTFFEGEVLVWRKGAEPASEAIAVPSGVGLAWSPHSCGEFMARGPARLAIRIVDTSEGGVVGSLEGDIPPSGRSGTDE